MYWVLVRKPEGKRPLGRPRRRWGIILGWISLLYRAISNIILNVLLIAQCFIITADMWMTSS